MIPQQNGATHVKIMGIIPDNPRNLIYTQSFRCHSPYKWKTYHIISLPWYFEASAWFFFFSQDILVTNYFLGDLPSPSKYLSNGLIPQSFWTSLYEHKKSSFAFCPMFSRKVKSRFRALALGPVSRFWNKSSRQVGTSLDCTFLIGLANT